MKKIIYPMMLYALILMVLSAAALASTPQESVQVTVNSILDVLRDRALTKPDKKEERRSRIDTLIRERFDFQEMSQRSLAKHWKGRTEAEKAEFVSIFSDLLISSYIGKIETYTDEKVTYDNEELKGKGRYGVVSTTIVTKDVNIPIDYKVILKGDKWWVYDVVVEGVSFISTYRSQYNKVIIKESYSALIDKMKEKLNGINAM
jgi:phospholipid transport system substrate-binding protein